MTRTVRFLFALWMLIAGIAGTPAPCRSDTPVTVRPTVEIKRSVVRLSDIFDGVPSEIDRDIAQAPAPCKPAVYDEAVLDRLADMYRLEWKADNASGSVIDHAVVTSACVRITADMIRDAAQAKLKDVLTGRDRTYEIVLDNKNQEITLPGDGAADFELANFTYDDGIKRFRADLTAKTLRGPYFASVGGRVFVKRSVPVLARRLEGGNTIAANDIDFIQVPEERITADVVTDVRQLIGRELRRDKQDSDLIRSHDIVPQRLVLRGSTVTMRIETPFMSLSAQGKAQQDGAMGDTVRIMNTQSNRLIEGVVTGAGTVEIRTARRIAALN